MSTANKNYPLIKETDSTGQPLNAYDQLVTESNNFRRAVDKDMNEVENKVSSLIESGSNPNGTYIRFSDGTQICYKNNFSPTGTVGLSAGSLYRSDNILWTYPKAFSSDVVTFGTALNRTNWANASNTNKWNTAFIQWSYESRPVVAMNFMAIGRWK